MAKRSTSDTGRRTKPETLIDFRGRHAGDTVIVCGCGASLKAFEPPSRLVTIGVNDVGRLFAPTYLVVLNARNQFKADRFRFVERSRADAVFSQLDLRIPHPRQVRIRLGKRGGTDVLPPDRMPYTRNSPYVAVVLAAYMGAQRIGLIGVDFTDDHFFAQTGRHRLNTELSRINQEYVRLHAACNRRDIEIVNLSRSSRLTALPKVDLRDWLSASRASADAVVTAPKATDRRPRVYGVNYKFLACGDVFTHGLRHAAADLGIEYADSHWDTPDLLRRVQAFEPDLLFVVHGRRFAQRHAALARRWRSAVWLLDEPYEVDDTRRWSSVFDTVFVNDTATLDRHRNAHYLPVAFDVEVHRHAAGPTRPHKVGFIGGPNPTRERYLGALHRVGLLSYVVGGPWQSPELRRLCLARNVSPERTAELYQQTNVIINVFRDRHHFNRSRVQAWSMNPRVYEALACGALVVSERRPELQEVFPELPAFETEVELINAVRELVSDEQRCRALTDACRERLVQHTYARVVS